MRYQAIIYNGYNPRSQHDEERIYRLPSIEYTNLEGMDATLGIAPRLNYAKLYTVQYNVKAQFLGAVRGQALRKLIASHRSCSKIENDEPQKRSNDEENMGPWPNAGLPYMQVEDQGMPSFLAEKPYLTFYQLFYQAGRAVRIYGVNAA